MPTKKPWYQHFSLSYDARERCRASGNTVWYEKHDASLEILLDKLPHGSGLDGTWVLNEPLTRAERIVLDMSYHKMNDAGYYDGWIDFRVGIQPSLSIGITIQIAGNFGRRQDIKEYLYDILDEAFRQEVEL